MTVFKCHTAHESALSWAWLPSMGWGWVYCISYAEELSSVLLVSFVVYVDYQDSSKLSMCCGLEQIQLLLIRFIRRDECTRMVTANSGVRLGPPPRLPHVFLGSWQTTLGDAFSFLIPTSGFVFPLHWRYKLRIRSVWSMFCFRGQDNQMARVVKDEHNSIAIPLF